MLFSKSFKYFKNMAIQINYIGNIGIKNVDFFLQSLKKIKDVYFSDTFPYKNVLTSAPPSNTLT